MPLTAKGEKILQRMRDEYGSEKKAKQVFYASANSGKIKGVHHDAAPSWSNRDGVWTRDSAAPLVTAPNAATPPLGHRNTRYPSGGSDRSAFGSVSANRAWRGRSA